MLDKLMFMLDKLIFIINNKLHTYDYILYTIAFYIVIIASYYSLYVNLTNNNYTIIFIYFSIILLSYMKFKKFSYFIGYVYLLFANIIAKNFNMNINIKENLSNSGETLDEKIDRKSKAKESELENEADNAEEKTPKATPCESYILGKLAERKLTIEAKNNTNNAPQRSGNNLNLDTSTLGGALSEGI